MKVALLLLVLLVVVVVALRLSVKLFGPGIPDSIGVFSDNTTNNTANNASNNAESLGACPDTPNCHIRHVTIALSDTPPITDKGSTVQRIVDTVESGNGEIVTQTESYLHATFTSRLLGYIDDFECLAVAGSEQQNQQTITVQCRSASRIGRSDFGVNKKRIDAIIDAAGFETVSG